MLRRSILLPLALALPLFAQPPKTLRVLFIGNSYTYYNNLPKLVESVAAAQKDGPRIATEASLSGGKTLKWHWENQKALELIRRGNWDFVVLQEHSTLGNILPAGSEPAIADPASYFEYAAKFHAEISKIGAKTILYATWARDGFPEQQRRLDDAFSLFARQSGAALVPAGLAWTVARLSYPALRLHMPDHSHPTILGSYLNALLFYRCLTGRPAQNPPESIDGPTYDDPKNVPLVRLPWSDVVALNQIADRVAAQEPLRPVLQ